MIIFLSLLLLTCILTITYQYYVHRNRTKQLHDISEQLRQIVANDADKKVFAFTNDPVLQELVAEIHDLLEKMQMISANDRQLKAASKRMLSNIAHDMKTPLTVILGMLEIVILEQALDEKNQALLETAREKANQVIYLMNQFFDLAKLESNDIDIELSKVDLNEACRKHILEYYHLLDQQQFEVDIAIPEEAIFIQGNEEALGRIFSNLISNVMKYGQDGKYLGLSLRQDETFAYIDVMDKGKGIPKAFHEQIFERMYTLEDSRNHHSDSSGLGLTITKRLVERLNGAIHVQSIPYERTTFTIKFNKLNF